jgi:uncharacterized OB-fold protein
MPEWYEAFVDTVEAGEQYYLVCDVCGATGLPPRILCPACGHQSLSERPLSETATVASFTDIHVTTPKFHGTTPYTVVLAAFDEGVRLTGQLRGDESVAVGDTVALGTEVLEDGSTILTFEPEASDG